jgi:hypothetical protein
MHLQKDSSLQSTGRRLSLNMQQTQDDMHRCQMGWMCSVLVQEASARPRYDSHRTSESMRLSSSNYFESQRVGMFAAVSVTASSRSCGHSRRDVGCSSVVADDPHECNTRFDDAYG